MRKNILILGHNETTQFLDIYNQYTRLFDKEKYAVTVAYLTGDPMRDRLIADEVIAFNLPKKSLRMLKIGAIKKLYALCRSKKFEMVICHRYKPSYIMLWVALFQKIPCCIFVMHELHTMISKGRQVLIACLGRKNKWYAGVSNAVRDDMRNSLVCIPKNKIITLYNALDVELVEPTLLSKQTAREKLGLNPTDFVFGQLARLVPNKDQHTLIKAFAHIKSKCARAKLVILGEGQLAAELKQTVESHQLQDDVIFTGHIDCGFRYMKALDCFVLTSIQEAFGRVLLEAMLAKLPLIASRVNGIPEVMQNQGILVEPKDDQGFAHAMQSIYNQSQSEREKMGEEAYQHLLAHYSLSSFQQQFWQWYGTRYDSRRQPD